ncbi:transferrin-binding protein-like solute binding protein [Devosia chinhatensis]|uniref:Transferrin-binding protein B C-lobe/N-lobe beta-barrel domain-containing protein n=1 Tax=Devosia chinhatensis TaxID=429727 RepID=A0A0F5FMZ9_9HYPH|nr:transferrin-binding protein-like solute binding protein [Devosia chinhatensis]KKB09950.1 hypothetical protein VE26_09090 [Devosia chinhatensis]
MLAKFVLAVTCATLLSGCSLANLMSNAAPVAPAPATPPAAGSAASTNLSSSQVLRAYTQTFATPAFTSVTAAQTTGIAGYAAGPRLPTASASASSFKTAVVKISPDRQSLEITVEGRTFALQDFTAGPATVTINGQDYVAYGFSTDGAFPSNADRKDAAILVNGTYSSLAMFLRNAGDAMQNQPHVNDGFVMIATGGETPINGMPSQIVHYSGQWFTVTPQSFENGNFLAQADFANRSLNWTATALDNSFTDTGTATIDGNRFVGTLAFGALGVNDSAQVVGSFYGPNAEEIAGVVSGNGTVNGAVVPVGGGFFGNKVP